MKRRRKRPQTIIWLLVVGAALCFVRFGPRQSVFEQAVYFVTDRMGSTARNTLLPYGDTAAQRKAAERERERAAVLVRENAHLREEMRRLGAAGRFKPPPNAVPARVSGRDPASWARRVTVNRGLAHGIEPGFIATTSQGLAGRVDNCSDTTCSVRLIVDPAAAVSCEVLASEKKPKAAPVPANATDTTPLPPQEPEPIIYCMAYGNAAQELDVVIVSSTAAAHAGDVVYTSGYDGLYPRGLRLGVITGHSRSHRFRAMGMHVRPDMDFRQLDFLLLSPP